MLQEKELVEKLRLLKPSLAQQYAVCELGYFGSYATGEANDASDVDILVEFAQPVGLEFFRVQDLLEKAIGKRVDLVTPKAIKAQLKDRIYSQLKRI